MHVSQNLTRLKQPVPPDCLALEEIDSGPRGNSQMVTAWKTAAEKVAGAGWVNEGLVFTGENSETISHIFN